MSGELGKIRRGQIVTTFGVGAMVPIKDETFMLAGLEDWPAGDFDLHEMRLERSLGKLGFRQPPAGDGSAALPAVRFPRWYYCPSCNRLDEYTKLALPDCAECRHCDDDVHLVPSRFVVACKHGHIDDFPYRAWVHEGRKSSSDCKLTISNSGTSSSLRSIEVKCITCSISRSLEGIFKRQDLVKVAGKCFSKRPWLSEPGPDCDQALTTLQRGASNVWFSEIRSALSIPPWSDEAYQIVEAHWNVLRGIPNAEAMRAVLSQVTSLDIPTDELIQAAEARKLEDAGEAQDDLAFRRQEYQALLTGRAESSTNDEFVAREGNFASELAPYFDKIVIVDRLREVRVNTGFTRVGPPGTDVSSAPLSNKELPWLPAIEVRGEGLFLTLNESRLAEWEANPALVDRARWIDDRYREVCDRFGVDKTREITARGVLIHTLAHALIDSFSLDSGYPASALRERLYSEDGMRGLLIYTATADSAGSLGGIVRQAEPVRFHRVLLDAVERFGWCSADPVCVESFEQGVDGLNLAACHSCALLPETSCSEQNMFLDRVSMVGTPENAGIGYFAPLIGGG